MSITKFGDLWVIGEHRLICGDATSPTTVASLMGDEQADLSFTSPPYLGQRKYISGVGDWNQLMKATFTILPVGHEGQVLVNLGLVHRAGEVHEYWHQWREWMRSQGWRYFGCYIWDMGSGLPGDWNGRLARRLSSCFTTTAWQKSRTRPRQSSRRPSDIVMFQDCETPTGTSRVGNPATFLATHKIPDDVIRVGRRAAPPIARAHPAVFPVKLATEMITAYSDLGQIIYEPFCGSGTTIIAAQKTGRRCRAIELQPEYATLPSGASRRRQVLWPFMHIAGNGSRCPVGWSL